MSAKVKKVEFSLKMTYICPNTKEAVEVGLNKNDFEVNAQDCPDCGSHGTVIIDVDCRSCGKFHEITFKEW
jgi:hypothetical protein